MSKVQNLDLKAIVADIVKHHPSISKICMFGSRAYETNSLSSDIDLLAFSDEEISPALVNEWLHHEYPYADLFLYDDVGLAQSASNGSKIRLRQEKYSSIEDQLDAILLWDKQNLFNDSFLTWSQKALMDFIPPMSIIPDYEEKPADQINRVLAKLEKDGLAPFFSGSSPKEIAEKVIDMVSIALNRPDKWAKKARSFRFDYELKNEYDFQNLIHLILRPVFPGIEVEPFEIKFDENVKKADFAVCHNKVVIEAKWIEDSSKKASVLKTIEGLKDFYSRNGNVECLIFLILYDPNVSVDKNKIENEYSNEYSDKPIFIRLFENK